MCSLLIEVSKTVLVLRIYPMDNFMHPYPEDSDIPCC